MMRPQPRFFIPGIAAFMPWNTPDRLMAMIASQRSVGKVLDVGGELDAGIVHQDVHRAEDFASVSATIAAIWSGWEISAPNRPRAHRVRLPCLHAAPLSAPRRRSRCARRRRPSAASATREPCRCRWWSR